MSRKKRTARNHRTADRRCSPRPWRLSKRLTLLGGVVAGVLVLLGIGLLMRPERRSDVASQPAPPPRVYPTSAGDATFVGRAVCSTCHPEQDRRWHGSHHDLAMQVADEQTVRGNFDNVTFTHRDVTTTFFRRDGKFFVRTDGPDGQLHDYEVAYTFGVTPLQQYLIAFPGGAIRRWASPGIAGRRTRVGSAGSISILSSGWRPAIRSTGRVSTRPGTISAPSATPPISRSITDWTATGMRRRGRNSMSPARRATAPAHGMWRGQAGGTVPTPEEPSKGLMVQLKGRDDAAWMMDPHTGSVKRTTPLRRGSRSKRVPAAMPGAASSTTATCPADRSWIPIVPRCWRRASIMPMARSRMRCMSTGRFAEQDVPCWRHLQRLPRPPQPPAPGHRQRALRPLSLARTVRHTGAPLPPHWLGRVAVRGVSYAGQDLHGCGCPAGSQLPPAAAGSVGAARDAQRVQRLSHRAPAAVGG